MKVGHFHPFVSHPLPAEVEEAFDELPIEVGRSVAYEGGTLLAYVLCLFYSRAMLDSNPLPVSRAAIASAILSTSVVTRLGLACSSEPLRERSADELAGEIIERLMAEAAQLTLAL